MSMFDLFEKLPGVSEISVRAEREHFVEVAPPYIRQVLEATVPDLIPIETTPFKPVPAELTDKVMQLAEAPNPEVTSKEARIAEAQAATDKAYEEPPIAPVEANDDVIWLADHRKRSAFDEEEPHEIVA